MIIGVALIYTQIISWGAYALLLILQEIIEAKHLSPNLSSYVPYEGLAPKFLLFRERLMLQA